MLSKGNAFSCTSRVEAVDIHILICRVCVCLYIKCHICACVYGDFLEVDFCC